MAPTSFESLCNLLFEVSQLPLVLCQQDGTPLYWLPHTETSDESPESNRSLLEKFAALGADPTTPFVEILDPTFFLAVVKPEGENYLLIGPAAPIEHDDASILKLSVVRNVPEEKRKAYCERLKHISVFSFRNFLATVSLVNYIFNQVVVPPDSILFLRPTNSPNTEEALTHALFETRESQVMHTPASFEHYILQAVSDGNITKLRQALLSPVSGAVGKMSSDPVRQEKYTFISFVTLVTRAAITGGLDPELAYSLSDIYCQSVDRSQNILEISKLAMEMCLDFTEKVAAAQGKARLSPSVAACCEYISGHLHDEIDLGQLSSQVRLGSKSLSQKFKSETGLSVIDYIHQERVKEAQSLLQYSDYSISEIGYFLQYGSQSYFSSIFKKFSGETPQQFRGHLNKQKYAENAKL
jgi:AraC-like DNA-binding protein